MPDISNIHMMFKYAYMYVYSTCIYSDTLRQQCKMNHVKMYSIAMGHVSISYPSLPEPLRSDERE